VHLLGVAPDVHTKSQELIWGSNFAFTPNADSFYFLIRDPWSDLFYPSLFPLFQINGNKSFLQLE
jgi:hypothetical protein